MIHSSASFAFLKKSKSLHGEVSGLCDSERSINRPPYVRRVCARKNNHMGIIYPYATHYNSATLRVILRRLAEAQTIVIITCDISFTFDCLLLLLLIS